MRTTCLWLGAGTAILFALYCLLGLLQAGSLYAGERAQANLRLRGSLGIASTVGAIVLAVLAARAGRTARQRT